MRHVFRYLTHDEPREGVDIVLAPDDSHHLARVVRRRAGDMVEVIGPSGDLWPCEVRDQGPPSVLGVTGPARSAPATVPLSLWVGLADAGRLDLVAEKAAELGVSHLGVMVNERARRVPDAAAWRRRATRMSRLADAAARQSGRGVRPVQMGLVPFAHVLAEIPLGEGILLDPRADVSLVDAMRGRPAGGGVTLLVGPDTGFSDTEVGAARDAGVDLAHLGAGVLRAETAGVTAVVIALGAMGGLG